jgi:hypothetical protein
VFRLNECIETIPFIGKKIINSDCVWFNCLQLKDSEFDVNEQKKYFESLMYAVDFNEFFSEVAVDDKKVISLFAEQYGGVGIGSNGGGARCGNIDNYQIKGIGVTPVLGLTDNLYNSNGMFPLYEAITEAINYEIYNTILPIGTVHYYGVVHIGSSPYFVTAENRDKKQIGVTQIAIGIREKCTRLGHFLAAGYYKPHPAYKDVVKADTARVRACN